ncbi:MAG: cation-transporting P-type ATPase [Mycobacterium sp.]|nr:cation-transporting P-type ATPase [Mycobacterium sp.]
MTEVLPVGAFRPRWARRGPAYLVVVARDAGLTTQEAARRLAADGANVLPAQGRTPWPLRFAANLVHFFAILFWIAGILAFVAGMPQLGVAIFAVVLLNAVFAFAQEERAQHATDGLRQMLPRLVTVVRDGVRRQVSADTVVVGDTVLLAEGDRVCADVVVIDAANLSVDTSALTGESVPEHPADGETVFAGCFVVEGEARTRVSATGSGTRLASIAKLTARQRHAATPLRRELDRLSRIIAVVAVSVGAVFFVVAALIGMPLSDGFLFAVGVTVAVVPEGLLPTVTLALAIGAQRMAGKRALVRHLEAVETLGSTTFICTDKTGTLTQNEMSVVQAWTPQGSARIRGIGYQPVADIDCDRDGVGESLRMLADAAVLCSTGGVELVDGAWCPHGDPMEAALDAFARRLRPGSAEPVAVRPIARFPFDAHRRRMSVVLGDRVLVKGAPDAIFPLCEAVFDAPRILADMAGRGLRVLAVACRDIAVGAAVPIESAEAEQGLRLLGLVGLQDPPRPAVAEVLGRCRAAGIRVAMVTGDHPDTAAAVACEVGLSLGDATVVVGADLPGDLGELGELIDRDGMVIARVTPEDKLRIARALRLRGHVVAMTGDGVNDAPALREAAIGVAMGRGGTDVAREAADVVLLDDNFETIVAAIAQGRSTFANIRRFLTYHLSDNVAELAPFVVWALSAGRFPLAIGVLQVLALDIGTDVLPALALGAEPPEERALDSPPTKAHLVDRALLIRAFGVLGLTEAVVALAAFAFLVNSPEVAIASGMASGTAFTAIVLGQAANAFACRSDKQPVWRIPLLTNPMLIAGVAAEIGILLVLLYVPPIAALLGQAGPPPLGYALAAVAVPAVVLADATHKLFRQHRIDTVLTSSQGRRRLRPGRRQPQSVMS